MDTPFYIWKVDLELTGIALLAVWQYRSISIPSDMNMHYCGNSTIGHQEIGCRIG